METVKKNDRALWIILATFPLITLPLFAWTYSGWNQPWLNFTIRNFFYAFGLSHLFSTLFVYLSSENRAHFSETKKNSLIYFVIPISILVYSATISSLSSLKVAGVANIVMMTMWLVHSTNIHHNTRQTYGVLQLMKHRSGFIAQKAGLLWETIFFASLTVLQLETIFIGDRRFPSHSLIAWITVAICFLLFLKLVLNYFHRPQAHRKKSILPFAYFSSQAVGFAAIAYDMRFFIAASAIHYVEYHVLMVSRFSGFQGNPSKWTDRTLAFLSRNTILFLVLPVALGLVQGYFILGRAHKSLPLQFGVAFGLVDSIFLFHYFLEGFIWKMRVPFYRRTIKLPSTFSKEVTPVAH